MGNDGDVLWKKKLCGGTFFDVFYCWMCAALSTICSAVLCAAMHTVLFSSFSCTFALTLDFILIQCKFYMYTWSVSLNMHSML